MYIYIYIDVATDYGRILLVLIVSFLFTFRKTVESAHVFSLFRPASSKMEDMSIIAYKPVNTDNPTTILCFLSVPITKLDESGIQQRKKKPRKQKKPQK